MKMNQTQTNQADKLHTELDPTAIDNILATEDQLVPTSGFLASVMERVREEATAPPPIPFPWKRAIPGILLAAVVFGGGAFEFVRHALPAVRELSLTQPHLSAAFDRSLEQAAWVALALGVSLFSWLLSKRLAGRSGLL
jgi:hypothetical protein